MTDGGGLEALPVDDWLLDQGVAWHSMRMFDFAGLDDILYNGIYPDSYYSAIGSESGADEIAICASASPKVAERFGMEASSFYAYSLGNFLSLAIVTGSPIKPSGRYGFMDEIRLPRVEPDMITGILVNAETLDVPLTELPYPGEPKKPVVNARYIDRSAAQLMELGGINLYPHVCDYLDASLAGTALSSDETHQLQDIILQGYARVLEIRGVTEPTLADALNELIIGDRPEISVLVYGEEHRANMSTAIAAAARRRMRNLPVAALSDGQFAESILGDYSSLPDVRFEGYYSI